MKRIVFDVPKWSLYLHRDARALPSALEADRPVRQLEDELFERLYAGEAEALPESGQHRELGQWAREFHAACDAHPDFARLQSEVRGDAFMAGLAVEKLVEKLRPEQPATPQDLRKQLSQGCSSASAAVDQARESLEGMAGVGWGTATGAPRAGAVREVLKKLQTDARLQRISAMAGKFKRLIAGRRRQQVRNAVGEIADIERGDALDRTLPSEFARLANRKLRLAFLRDLHEKATLQYAMRGQDDLGKGPLVVCLDKSGSMDGPRDEWAAAVGLALLDLAHREGRPFGLLTFDSHVRTKVVVPVGHALPQEALFEYCSGGTNLDGALAAAIVMIRYEQACLRKSDVVLITDGQSDPNQAPHIREQAKTLGIDILGMSIGMPAESLRPWCDEAVEIRELGSLPDGAAEKLAGG